MIFNEFLNQYVYSKKEMKRILKKTQVDDKCDALGNPITNLDYLTIHHIFKQVYGGEYTIDNCIALVSSFHKYLHYLETVDYDKYVDLNNHLKKIIDYTIVDSEKAKILLKKR